MLPDPSTSPTWTLTEMMCPFRPWAESAHSITALSCGYPTPVLVRVVHTEPGWRKRETPKRDGYERAERDTKRASITVTQPCPNFLGVNFPQWREGSHGAAPQLNGDGHHLASDPFRASSPSSAIIQDTPPYTLSLSSMTSAPTY